MGLYLQGASGNGAEVDASNRLLVTARGPAMQGLGAYRCVSKTGTLAMALATNADFWSFRWTHPTNIAVILSVKVQAVVLTTVTAANVGLLLFFARSYTADDSGGLFSTDFTSMRLSPSFPASSVGSIQIANTGTLTAGTRSLDSRAFGRCLSNSSTAAGNVLFQPALPRRIFHRHLGSMYPLVLAQNEGIVIQTGASSPGAGTMAATVEVDWVEAKSY